MIEVDNFDKIENLLDFDGSSIYLVWLVMRNKDGNTQAKGNNKNRTIKSYYFQTKEHYQSRKEEIIKICNLFNCRAYICLNKKPIDSVVFNMQDNVTELLKQLFRKDSVGLNGIIDSAVMKSGTRGEKRWLVDVDTKDDEFLFNMSTLIRQCRSGYDDVIIDYVPTAHGTHIITHPFDLSQYNTLSDVVKSMNTSFEKGNKIQELPEIKKDCLTLLYANVID